MLQVVLESVLREFSFDGVTRTAHTCAVRTSALDHEAGNDAVEDKTVVKAFIDQADEIVDCIRRDFRIELSFHHAAIFHGDCNNWICHGYDLFSEMYYS